MGFRHFIVQSPTCILLYLIFTTTKGVENTRFNHQIRKLRVREKKELTQHYTTGDSKPFLTLRPYSASLIAWSTCFLSLPVRFSAFHHLPNEYSHLHPSFCLPNLMILSDSDCFMGYLPPGKFPEAKEHGSYFVFHPKSLDSKLGTFDGQWGNTEPTNDMFKDHRFLTHGMAQLFSLPQSCLCFTDPPAALRMSTKMSFHRSLPWPLDFKFYPGYFLSWSPSVSLSLSLISL